MGRRITIRALITKGGTGRLEMADVIELLLGVGRLQRLLRQAAPRIDRQSEYEFAPLVSEHIGYLSDLSQFLTTIPTLPSDQSVFGSTDLLRQSLPRIEVCVQNRDWRGMLEGSYNFAASPSTREVITDPLSRVAQASIGPLPGTIRTIPTTPSLPPWLK
jgi:hypothetical protein